MAEATGYVRHGLSASLGENFSDPLSTAVAAFGRAVSQKLGRGGAPEDQLRGPAEMLLGRLGAHIGVETVAYGEVHLKTLRARPDYAVDVGSRRVGYIELKAPGRGVPPDWKPDSRERKQWKKLSALPNVIYTDGTRWARYKYGEPAGPVAELVGTLSDLRQDLRPADAAFETVIREFLLWEPEQPRSLADLVRIVAGLCRLLRDEVSSILSASPMHAAHEDLTLLAADWRRLLFPGLEDTDFADAYAQTITFAMLLARIDGVLLDKTPLHEIGRQLRKKHSLMGRAFSVLTDSDATEELRVIETLRQVIGSVKWDQLDDGQTDIYAVLYEKFLAQYDPDLRKKSGSYYTPQPVAHFMVDFVDEILRQRLGRSWGFADDEVIVVDPGMGTGTFLVEIIRAVAATVDQKQGRGARPAQLRELFRKRLVGFEIQVAPYAVAELRLHQVLKTRFETDIPASEVRFLTDALENPREQQQRFPAAHKILGKSRDEANRIKRETRVMVVIGNPPHVDHATGHAPWIEERREPKLQPPSISSRPSLDEFRAAGRGRYESDLHALQWYFWRWALWKVFDAHPDHPAGVVAFLSPASYATGQAYAGMREYLRRTCDEGWIIDLSPEGNRPDANTRIFGAEVGRQLSIGIFARSGQPQLSTPAVIHHTTVTGTRTEKLQQLDDLKVDAQAWRTCQKGWQDPFLAASGGIWEHCPRMPDLMPWTSRGVTAGRTWIYSPDPGTLRSRWQAFIAADPSVRRSLFREARDRKITTRVDPLPGFPRSFDTLASETGDLIEPIQVGYRSFDRQWIIPDNRLMVVPRPPLWAVRSDQQVYVTEQNSHPIESGPALTFTGLIPDIDHYNARSGRALPLYRDLKGTIANFTPGLALFLSRRLGLHVSSEDLLAYIAGTVAHPGYTRRFHIELQQPGVRVPLTAEPELWTQAVEIGRTIIWLHTYGERYVDEQAGRPQGLSALAEGSGPRVLNPIADTPEGMPEEIKYVSETWTLHIGAGTIAPVSSAVWNYDVGGMRIVTKWFDYRSKKPRHKRRSSPLDNINCVRWTPQSTSELLQLITILDQCVKLEPSQARLLADICDGQLITVDDLTGACILPPPPFSTKLQLDDPNTPPML